MSLRQALFIKMKYFKTDRLNIQKAARFAIALNAIQVLTIAAVIGYVLLTNRSGERTVELGVLILALLIIAWGAALDIREARNAERAAEQTAMLEEAYRQLESLNGTLRKQRHDFINHLQVMFSLMEMQEYNEAMHYIEGVYSDIQRAGGSLKTAIPAVNALIAAKRADCLEHGIELKLLLRSSWQALPVPGWEMCRVLGNLIDNARDALLSAAVKDPEILLEIDENADDFRFSVSNNGPAIPPEHLKSIFRMGFTTKRDGHGFGLAIVREILETHGGAIEATSNDTRTVFSGTVPRSCPTS